MNIIEHYKDLFIKFIKPLDADPNLIAKINVERPKKISFGDLSFNAPLILSSSLKNHPC